MPAIATSIIAGGLLLALVVVGIVIARRPNATATPLAAGNQPDSEDVIRPTDAPSTSELATTGSDASNSPDALQQDPGNPFKFVEPENEEFEESIEIEPTKAVTFDPADLPDFETVPRATASTIVGDNSLGSTNAGNESIRQTDVPSIAGDPTIAPSPAGNEALVPPAVGTPATDAPPADPMPGMPPATNVNQPANPFGGFDALPPAVVQDPKCDECRGVGRIPMSPFKAYVSVEGMPPPAAELAIIDQPCPKCHPRMAQDEKDREITAIEARLQAGAARHQPWEQKTSWQLVQVQTKLATIHAQLSPAEANQVGMALERMAMHILETTDSTELAGTHPDDFDMIIVDGRDNYLRLLEVMEPEWKPLVDKNWELLPQTAGGLVGSQAYFFKGRIPPAHMAVSLAGGRQMYRIVQRPPDWLVQGFEAYCEYAVLGRNLIRSVDYKLPNVKLSSNWWNDMQMLARMNQLRRLDTFVTKSLQDYDGIDYVTSFSFVAYLLRSEPEKFLTFCRSLNTSPDQQTALTEAYGQSIDELQAGWLKWLAAPR